MAPASRCSSCEKVISWLDAFGSNIQVALQLSLSLEKSTAVLDRVQIRWLLCEQFWHKQTAGGNWWTHRRWVTSTCRRAVGRLLRPTAVASFVVVWVWDGHETMKTRRRHWSPYRFKSGCRSGWPESLIASACECVVAWWAVQGV